MVRGGAIATAELAGLTVDQCLVTSDRYTLIAPDAYRGDYLEIALWGMSGNELARESLYEEDDEDDDELAAFLSALSFVLASFFLAPSSAAAAVSRARLRVP
jgi:hypothetical protein